MYCNWRFFFIFGRVQLTLNKLGESAPHDVYVLDGCELELHVLVESLDFVAFPSRSVGHRVDLRQTTKASAV